MERRRPEGPTERSVLEIFVRIIFLLNPDKYCGLSHMNFRAKNVMNAIREKFFLKFKDFRFFLQH